MKRRLMKALMVTLALVGVLSMTGCSWFLSEVLFGAGGRIVDARGDVDSNLSGFSVTIAPVTGSGTRNTQSTSTGSFSFGNVESGTYILTASKPGWFVPPVEVNVGGLAQGFPDVPAFALQAEDEFGISFIAVWRNSEDGNPDNDIDVDVYLTFPTSYNNNNNFSFGGLPHMAPRGVDRGKVYWNRRVHPPNATGGSVKARLDNDTTMLLGRGQYGPNNPQLPETATLLNITHNNIGENNSDRPMKMAADQAGDITGLRTAFLDGVRAIGLQPDDIRWGYVGAAEVFLDTHNNANLSSQFIDENGEVQLGADARLYVIQTIPREDAVSGGKRFDFTQDQLTYNYLGEYRVDGYTNIATSSMVRINMFVDDEGFSWYQIIPSRNVIPQGRAGISSEGSGAIRGVRGRRVTD